MIETRNKSYQRGLVLGFTMAEVVILIIFVLLVTFVALLAVHGEKRKEAEQEYKESISKLQGQIKEFEKLIGGEDIEKLLREMKRTKKHREDFERNFGDKSLDNVKRELEEAKKYREKIQNAAEASGFSPKPDGVKDALISYGKLISAGKGTEVPSCWTREDGTVEYIYDINLTPTGLVVRETDLPHRVDERRTLPVENIILEQDISEKAFLLTTSHLFEFSQSKECRFFVRVFDSTGPTEKAVYKSRLKTVEARFYKFISSESF